MRPNMSQRILGIDPGFGRMGWGVVERRGGDWVHVAHGCVETSKEKRFTQRLLDIESAMQQLITTYHPTYGAVEELFFYKNVTTGVQVGHARGVILLTFSHHNIPTYEYTPLHIKQAITGYGKADKQQMQRMVQMQLQLQKKITSDDAADALAVALTCGISRALEDKLRTA